MKLKEYENMIKGMKCKRCGQELLPVVDHYPHADGWSVDGFPEKQWLSVHCTKCKYDWSLWKLGVVRV